MLAQIRRKMAALPPPDPRQPTGHPSEREQEEKRRQLMQMLAEIEGASTRRTRGPRSATSARRRAKRCTRSYDALRRRIEDRGTRNFPEIAGQKLYGELTMNVTVNTQGRVVEADVVRGSARALDRRAIAIARARRRSVFTRDAPPRRTRSS